MPLALVQNRSEGMLFTDTKQGRAMASERLKSTKYMVYWRSRVLLPDRVMRGGIVQQVCKDGFVMKFEQAVPLRSEVNIEFHVKYKGELCRIRAKTKVLYCVLMSKGGVELELKLILTSDKERHILNNVLQMLENSKAVDLRVP